MNYTDEEIYTDIELIFDTHPKGFDAALKAVREGKVDGRWYCKQMDGSGCLLCHVGNVLELADGVALSQRLACFDVEHLIRDVRPGQTPATSPELAQVERCMVRWAAETKRTV